MTWETLSALGVLLLAGAGGSPAGPGAAPNILLIIVDDLNNDLGAYGHPSAKTPNIDRLAARGMRFDRAYVQCPLCNPSRTSVLSGLRPDTTQVFRNTQAPRWKVGAAQFLQQFFRAHGYFTAQLGKVAHQRFPEPESWDVSQAMFSKAADENQSRLDYGLSAMPEEQEYDRLVARSAAALLAPRQGNEGRPFFIAVGFRRPHAPFRAPARYFDLYPIESVPLPDRRTTAPRLALFTSLPTLIPVEGEVRPVIAAYRACTTFVDAQIGLLLDEMDRRNLWKDTIVVLWGDNGYMLGEHGMWTKDSLFEQAARVPLILAAPGVRPGSCRRLVEAVDLYPTLVDLAGLVPPEGLEGFSFAPLLADPTRPWKKAAFTQTQPNRETVGRSVRSERYRYTEWSDGEIELYDHDVDAGEFENLARHEGMSDVLSEMRELLRGGWRGALPDSGPEARRAPASRER
jgi:uncharacterized sulfatase